MKIHAAFYIIMTVCLFSCGQFAKPESLHLIPPSGEKDTTNGAMAVPRGSLLVILISDDQWLYVYPDNDIDKGKKYTVRELTDTLRARKSNTVFTAIIKAAKSATYKKIIDILDVMTIVGLKHYALVDITKPEEAYLSRREM